ncbi:MAG TPA: alpha-D-ribose 1-methylphosphonate 5-triphosphate diphosphatase [Afifellaceae bacterium]|nr:alpha-D-ribose 1-methylphosphonate 5-triphosphate diphosphatase [Afifellaceae bacterium]
MQTPVRLAGGQVLAPDGSIGTADIHVADGLIADAPAQDAVTVDCRGYHVLPGIVDVHGDAFELELNPRPGVDIPFAIAMGSVDRQLLANSITTAFHGLSVSWEPGARNLAAARRFMDGLDALRPRLAADHRVQIRWETFAHDAIGDVERWLARDPAPAIAINDHATSTLETVRSGDRTKLLKWAQRAGVSLDDYLAAVDTLERRAGEVAAKVSEVAGLAGRHGAVMLAHDEASRAERIAHRALGMGVSEFPIAPDAAADAVANGEHVVMGGPNAIRGGSHKGDMSAVEAIEDGLCTVLASDYYYPSLLHAAEDLVRRGSAKLDTAWRLISANPAAAMALDDRGSIETGRRADLVAVDCSGPWRLVHTVAGGALTTFGV